MTKEELLNKITYGCPSINDIMYRLFNKNNEEYVTMYNDEITGYSEGLKNILKFGDNAYYWLATPSQFAKLGWSGEIVK